MSRLLIVLLILGFSQGVAEFLPISSSGHLSLLEQVPFIHNSLKNIGKNIELFINVALHVATLIAVIIYLWKDIVRILGGFFKSLGAGKFESAEFKSAVYILAASVPAGVLGMLFHDFFENVFKSLVVVCIMLIINGIILIMTKKIPLKDRNIEQIGISRSVIIGFFQALAIMPGISRSGMTIAGGMFNGLAPVEAARFSFLMAIPVIAGAGFVEGIKAVKGDLPSELLLPLLIAMAVTVIVALFSLKVLFAIVKRIRVDIFGYYTIAVGITGLIVYYILL